MRIFLLALGLVFQSLVSFLGQKSAGPSVTNVVFQSVDGGQTWQDVSAGLPENVTIGQIFATDSEVFLGSENGMFRSSTAVATPPVWENQTTLPNQISDFFPGRTGLYACSYGKGIFKKLPGMGIWVPVYNNLNDKYIHSLVETADGNVFVCGQSGIFKSTDKGVNWKQVFDEGQVWNIAVAGGVMIGGGYRGVLRSADNGEHWNWVMTADGAAISTGLAEDGFTAITYDGSVQRLCKSADAGKNWQHADENLASLDRWMNNIKQVGTDLFCSREAGILRSSDQGKTWQLVFSATGKRMFTLAVSGQVIFAVKVTGC